MANVLITGGLGFIGANLVRQIQEQDPESTIIVVDDFGSGDKWNNWNRLFLKSVGIVSIEEFYKNVDYFLKKFSTDYNIHTIVHLGAISSTQEKDVDKIWHANVELTERLLKSSNEAGYKFIFASSAGVYGAGEHGFSETIQLEDLKPLTPYAFSKLIIEKRIAKNYKDSSKIFVVRFFNVWGLGDSHKIGMQSWASQLMNNKSKYENLIQLPCLLDHEGKLPERDFVYVKDVAKLLITIIEADEFPYKTINCGTGHAVSFKQFAEIFFKVKYKTPPKIQWEETKFAKRRDYQYFTKADTTLLYNVGFHTTDLKTEIEEYIHEYTLLFDSTHPSDWKH